MSLTSGTHLGPYQILSPLGAGGMGEVYRARDTRLGRDVAVKVLPSEFAEDPERLRRFEQEAKATATLNHPNILVLYDIGSAIPPMRGAGSRACPEEERSDDVGEAIPPHTPGLPRPLGGLAVTEGEGEAVHYIVTELLEGETLRQRLRGGALPPAKAVDFGIQIAEGLATAHEKGIVHRDIKPENLFVTQEGRVKILDFGLAKLEEGPLTELGTMTSPAAGTFAGTVLGTVGYMAPEQVRGEPADARSDIFALGCVLYEMLCGKQAFLRDTVAETMVAILKDPVPEVSAKGIPATPELNRTVAHCLEKRPGERFQSARDVAFAMRSLVTSGAAIPAAPANLLRIRWFVAVAVSLAVVTASMVMWSPWRTKPAAGALNPKRVVVAGFENRTGDRALDPIGRMAADWITQGLSRIEGIEVVPSTSMLLARSDPEAPAAGNRDPLRALTVRTGAGTLVSGAYYLQGKTVQFQVTITDAIHGRLLRALDPVAGPVTAPMEAIDTLRQQAMGAVATNLGTVHDLGAGEHPPNYDAYREFIAGFELFGTDYDQALIHFERAAELDPDFQVSLLYAAFIHYRAGDFARAQAILRDLNTQRERLTPLGRSWLDAMSGYTTHHYFEALQHLRVAEQRAPQDPLVNYWLGWLALLSNRPEEAIDIYGRLTSQPWPGHPLGAWRIHGLCSALHMVGDHRKELEEARRNQTTYPEMLRSEEVRALAALGRVEELGRVIDKSLAVHDRLGDSGEIMLAAAQELRTHGHREAALALANRAAAWYRARSAGEVAQENTLSDLAYSLLVAERWDESRAAFEDLAKHHPEKLDVQGSLGVLAARRGDRSEAERVADRLRTLERPYMFGLNTYWRACIAAQLGGKQSAVDLLTQAFGEGLEYGPNLHRDQNLEPLWGYPPFVELITPKG